MSNHPVSALLLSLGLATVSGCGSLVEIDRCGGCGDGAFCEAGQCVVVCNIDADCSADSQCELGRCNPRAPTPPTDEFITPVEGPNTVVAGADWWDERFPQRARIVLQPRAGAQPLGDFPVMVPVSPAQLGAHNPVLRFVDQSGQVLAHELDYISEDGVHYVWVSIPNLAADAPTDLWLYVGGPDDAPARDSSEVWSEYDAVWHLGDGNDATGNGVDGAPQAAPDPVAGVAGDALAFDGAADRIDLGHSVDLLRNAEGATVTAWVLWDAAISPSGGNIIAISVEGQPSRKSRLALSVESGGELAVVARARAGDDKAEAHVPGAITPGQWHWVAVIVDYDDGVIRTYVDGEAVDYTTAQFSHNDTSFFPASVASIASQDDGSGDFWPGCLDEVRVASVTRTSDWIAAQYSSMTGGLANPGAVEQLAAP